MIQVPNGLLYVSITGNIAAGDSLTGAVLRFNPRTGKFVDVFTSNSAAGCATHLHRPEGLTFGPDGNLYITAFRANGNDTDKILIFDGKTGACRDQIDLDVVNGPRATPQAILFGPNGRLFVPMNNILSNPDVINNEFDGEVRRYNVQTKIYDVFVKSAQNGGPLIQPWYLTFGKTSSRNLAYGDED